MEGFRKFVENIGGVWAVVLAGGSLLPVLALFSGLAPQGKFFTEDTLATLTGFLALIVLLNVWVFAAGVRRSTGKRVFAAISLASFVMLCAYFYMLGRFQLHVGGKTILAGCDWTQFALEEARHDRIFRPDTCPGNADFLFRDAATPEDVWTSASMAMIERVLYLLWGGMTICWSALVSFFAVAFLAEEKNLGTPANSP